MTGASRWRKPNLRGTKKVRCSVCGKDFPAKDAKYEPARPAIAGIYTLCPTCYPKFMKIYRSGPPLRQKRNADGSYTVY